jgi:hypothetical protein
MRLVRGAAAAAVGIAVLAGCSDGGTANQTLPPTSTTAAETSATHGPSDLPMPRSAQQRTAEGFNSFTDYYIRLINRLQANLDSQYLREFSRNCETCDRLATDADSDASRNYRYSGGTLVITAIAPPSLTEEGAEVAFTLDQAAYSVLTASGEPVEGLTGDAVTGLPAGMVGVWAVDHWVVTNLSFG